MLQSGKPISQIAKEMGLTESALRNWVKPAQIDQAAAPNGPLTTEERQELNRLRRGVQMLADGARVLEKGSRLLCHRELTPYELIEAEKAKFPIGLMCDVLDVSRSGYYAWYHRPPSSRRQENERLSQQIQDIHQESCKTYGAPRIHAALKARGWQVGSNRAARLMRQLDICVRPKRRFKPTTDSNHPFPVAQNMLERDFSVTEPDTVWAADITDIPTLQGWLYLAVIIDLFSRRVMGCLRAEHMRVELVLSALQAALGHSISAASGLWFQSGWGGQYASGDYQATLQAAGIRCSMSRRAIILLVKGELLNLPQLVAAKVCYLESWH